MPLLSVNGVPVEFPFQPYHVQEEYMKKVVEALTLKQNALLESPTGTGKTLCLLCSTLAWRESYKAGRLLNARNREGLQRSFDDRQADPHCTSAGESAAGHDTDAFADVAGHPTPRIIYTSRTHSQLSQVIRELKGTAYKVKSAIIGSREQLCIHEHVSKIENNAARTQQCRHLVTNGMCMYYNNGERAREKGTEGADFNLVGDIEDLVAQGTEKRVCPYYAAKSIMRDADIAFMPYNYIIDKSIRDRQQLNLQDAIIIIDEGHNINNVCEASSSLELSPVTLSLAMHELKEVLKIVESRSPAEVEAFSRNGTPLTPEAIQSVMQLLVNIRQAMATALGDKAELVQDGNYLYTLLESCNLTRDGSPHLIDVLESSVDVLTDELARQNVDIKVRSQKGLNLKAVISLVQSLFVNVPVEQRAAFTSNYRTVLQRFDMSASTNDVFGGVSRTKKREPGISFWCFSSEYAMKELLAAAVGARNIIITSGTLSPMATFAAEMGIDFPVQLANDHVITGQQLWAGVIKRGPAGQALNSSFDNRKLPDYVADLGETIAGLLRYIPDGVLVFFPSYQVMGDCISAWQQGMSVGGTITIWERIARTKTPITEPRCKKDFLAAMEEFKRIVADPTSTGAVLFAVARGKVSEGVDFSDASGRGVIVTGIPFPAYKDLRVQTKRQYLDVKHKTDPRLPTGALWYNQEGLRAVNQAIGRVIRHRYDYGAIVFLDDRFAREGTLQALSQWVRPQVKAYDAFGDAQKTLAAFFRNIPQQPFFAHAKSVQKEVPASPEAARDNTTPGPGSGPTIGIRRKHGLSRGAIAYEDDGGLSFDSFSSTVAVERPSTDVIRAPRGFMEALNSNEPWRGLSGAAARDPLRQANKGLSRVLAPAPVPAHCGAGNAPKRQRTNLFGAASRDDCSLANEESGAPGGKPAPIEAVGAFQARPHPTPHMRQTARATTTTTTAVLQNAESKVNTQDVQKGQAHEQRKERALQLFKKIQKAVSAEDFALFKQFVSDVRKPDVSLEAKLGELQKVLVQPGMRGLVDEVGLVVIPARHKHAYEQWLRQRLAKMG